MASNERSESIKDHVTWWRESYQRDTDAFERAHGRRPKTLFELARWLDPAPMRAPRNTQLDSN